MASMVQHFYASFMLTLLSTPPQRNTMVDKRSRVKSYSMQCRQLKSANEANKNYGMAHHHHHQRHCDHDQHHPPNLSYPQNQYFLHC